VNSALAAATPFDTIDSIALTKISNKLEKVAITAMYYHSRPPDAITFST